MTSEITPDQLRGAQLRTVLRGVDRGDVDSLLEAAASRLERLEAEIERLRFTAAETAPKDLRDEFDAVGAEVTAILQAAREAAEAMRERASIDAARWRAEAMAESEEMRRQAASDSEAMRRDAWVVGTEMLDQASRDSLRMREQAERDVLTVMGEAEREAHRLTSSARRESEDLVRSSSMDADKITAEATKRRDDIIDAANRQAAAAQERTRALEQRRDELLEELENVRNTLSRLEGSLEAQRETLELTTSEMPSVRVVPTRRPDEDLAWEIGETVRVVRTDSSPPEPQEETDEATDESESPVEESPPPAIVDETADLPSAEPESESEAEPATTVMAQAESDDVGALFASLRGGDPIETQPITQEMPVDGHDWIDDRDERLLPITNRALRGTKKAVTDLQNLALDHLRTDEGWRPDAGEVEAAVQGDLIALWAESFAAGHAVAEVMTGSKLKRPPTPGSDAAGVFALSLCEDVSTALTGAGGAQRERLSAASRVFRVWRTDEAERRIRELAIHAYQLGVEESVGAKTG